MDLPSGTPSPSGFHIPVAMLIWGPQKHDYKYMAQANQGGGKSTATTAPGPPPAGIRRTTSPQSAPRLYHRLLHDFEDTRNPCYIANRRESYLRLYVKSY